jgi:hypothetical protein
MPSDDQELRRRTGELYVAWTQVEEPQLVREPILSFGDLVAWLAEGKPLKPGQQPLLFSNQRLRADFQRLKRDLAYIRHQHHETGCRILEMPAVKAAASKEELGDRAFDGAKIRIRSGDGPIVYVRITMDDPADKPGVLLMEGPGGKMAREKLDPSDDNGQILLIKDLANEIDRLFVELLRNPASSGTFLK